MKTQLQDSVRLMISPKGTSLIIGLHGKPLFN